MWYTPYIHPLSTCVPSSRPQFLRKVWQKFNVKKLERKKNAKIKRWISSSFQYTRYIHPLSTCVPNFNLLGLAVPEKSVTEILMFENWNEKIKGCISSSSHIPVYIINPPIVHVCTNFQPSWPHSSWEKCGENVWLKIGKKNKEIKGRISSSSLIPVYTIRVCATGRSCRQMWRKNVFGTKEFRLANTSGKKKKSPPKKSAS